MIIDCDVETFDAGVAIALRGSPISQPPLDPSSSSAIAGGADARARETAQLLDVKVKEFAGMSAFVALDGRFGRFQSSEAMEAVTAQNAGDGGLEDLQHGKDLSVGAALAAQGEDVGFEFGTDSARLMPRDRGTVLELEREPAFLGALEPAPDGPFAHMIGGRDLLQREVGRGKKSDHFGSHLWGESGISVHVVRGGWRWVWFHPPPACTTGALRTTY